MIDYLTYGQAACVIFVIAAVVISFWQEARPDGTPNAPIPVTAFLLGGIGVLCLGSSKLITAYTSPRVTVEGRITYFSQVRNRKSADTLFTVEDSAGVSHPVSSGYAGPNLSKGETVRVTYLINQVILDDLVVLDGVNAGWTLHEGSGSVSGIALTLFGFALIVYPFLRRMYDS